MNALNWLGVVSLIWACLLAGERSAGAEESRAFLICIPDGPASTAEVVERLDSFLTPLGESLGASMTGEYHTRLADCDRYLNSARPSLVLYPLDLFLERRKSQKLTPLGEPVRVGAAEGITRYHLVAAADATLEGVKGGVLMSPHVRNGDFFTRVAFPGALEINDFQVKKTSSAIRALKKLKKGKIQAALLDESEHVAMQSLPFASSFGTLVSSDTLPNAPIAAVGADTSFQKRAAAALTRLCKDDPGACKSLELRAIRPVQAKTYRELVRRWKR